MSDAIALSNTLATFAATYLFHSTLLLATCWVFLRLTRTTSHFLVERTWKLAAVMGVITTLTHMMFGASLTFSLVERQFTSPDGIADGKLELGVDTSDDPSWSIENVGGAESALGTGPVAILDIPSESIDSAVVDFDQSVNFIPYRQPHNADLEMVVHSPTTGLLQESQHAEREGGFQSEFPMEPASSVLEDTVTASQALRALLPRILRWASTVTSVLVASYVLFGGTLFVIQSLRMQTRFATSRLLKDGPARKAIDRFLKRNGIRRKIRLLTSTTHHEPVTYGLFVWTIVLPQHTEERLGKEELKALLAHEVAHLVRGDVSWLWIGRLICTCLAFQPLNMLARRNWQQATEYLCDDWAVARGVRSISLARCLTQIAEWRFGRQTSNIGLAAGGTRATLVQRVERLVKNKRPDDAWAKPQGRRLLAAGACTVAIVLVGLTPRFALLFASTARSATQERVASVDHEDASWIHGEWQLLQEELLQLDADLTHADKLLSSTSHPSETAGTIYELNRRAASLRARRTHITSLFEKELRR